MSDVVFTDFEDFVTVSGSDKSEKKDKKVFLVKILVFVLAVLLFAELIISMVLVPCFSKPSITVSGLKSAYQQEFTELLGSMKTSSWLRFDTQRAASLLSSVPYIDSVDVSKVFPDRVIVSVKERVPVAKTVINNGGRYISVQIDKNGVLFTGNRQKSDTDYEIPLVSGLPVEKFREGMSIPANYRVLLDQIETVRSRSQKYFAAISEIQVVQKEYGNYELVLYPVHKHVRVLTDRSLNEEALKYMMVVLDVVDSIEPDVSEIDLRYGSVSYRTRSSAAVN
ncbi:cell division protein FtsQ/DivIB [Treponema peruense]|uniref:FtsQ-type POTRA domain-containing protein n=1 Tax=Treponema peruense TaxID=2787628 RepID=A0A7T3RBV9_9SPIR|nr:FtsQ-type POTRA domain-containing protein [Treponema peruense]QQA00256.1 FtsQ-type POTRA domain-containing protein [Treponema peruense]